MIHLTAELISLLVSCSPRGTLAASKAGVSRRALYAWLRRGEQGERPYVDLYRGWEAMRLSKTGDRRKDRNARKIARGTL